MNRDIGIVGGGPAGLSAALRAAAAGLSCTLYERGRIGSGIRCAEGLFDPLVGVPVATTHIRTRVRRAVLEVAGGRREMRFGRRSRFTVIDRSSWQRDLAAQAIHAGVDLREAHPADPHQLLDRHDLVIDARGSAALAAGWRTRSHAPGLAVQWRLAGDFSRWADCVEVAIHPTEIGYFWLFPKSTDQANVGFGWLRLPDRAPNPWAELEAYLRRHRLNTYTRLARTGGFLLTAPSIPNPHPRLIRVGDAAGLTSPLHGGGIDSAWLSGQCAVDAYLAGHPDGWPERLDRQFAPMRHLEQYVLRRWQTEGPAVLDRAAARLEGFSRVLSLTSGLLRTGAVAQAARALLGGKWPDRYYSIFPAPQRGQDQPTPPPEYSTGSGTGSAR